MTNSGYVKFVLLRLTLGGVKKYVIWTGDMSLKPGQILDEFQSSVKSKKNGIKVVRAGNGIMEYSADPDEKVVLMWSGKSRVKSNEKIARQLLGSEFPDAEIKQKNR